MVFAFRHKFEWPFTTYLAGAGIDLHVQQKALIFSLDLYLSEGVWRERDILGFVPYHRFLFIGKNS